MQKAGRWQDCSASRDGAEEQSSGYGRGKERADGQRRTTAVAYDADSSRISLESTSEARPLEQLASPKCSLESPRQPPAVQVRKRKTLQLSSIQ